MNGSALHRELLAAGVPSMAANDTGRVALGPPHKTKQGQWVVLPDGSAEWVGTGRRAPKPGASVLADVAAAKAAHVPPPPPPPPVDQPTLFRALAKAARGKTVTAKERAELDKAENL